MTESENLALKRIEQLIDRAIFHEKRGDERLKETLLAEAKIQAMVMDGADDTFFLTYHRYASDSFGVEFEITHGDPELMFGGV